MIKVALIHSQEHPARETKNLIEELGHKVVMENTLINYSIDRMSILPENKHPDLFVVDIGSREALDNIVSSVQKQKISREITGRVVLVFDEEYYDHFKNIGSMFFATYIVKPFTKNALAIKLDAARKRFEIYKRGFKSENLLYHHSHMSLLGRLTAGLAHELNNDLYIINSNSQLIKEYLEYIGYELRVRGALENKKVALILDSMPEAMERMQRGIEKIERITHGMHVFSLEAKEENKRQKINLYFLLDYALDVCNHIMKYHINVIRKDNLRNPFIWGNFRDLLRSFCYLFVHISDWTKNENEEPVTLTIETDAHPKKKDYAAVTISHKISTMIEEKLDTLWDLVESESPGLVILRDILLWNGSSIDVTTENNEPVYTLTLPMTEWGVIEY